jgi:glycosyltransferase involved in cell wall biosynthesis
VSIPLAAARVGSGRELRSFDAVKVSIIIAVYNEAATVGMLLEQVWAQPLPQAAAREIIIIESNSTDGSREIVAEFVARRAGAGPSRIQVIHQDRPHGKGHAIREGLAAASGDILLIQDADLEYDVADYPALIRPIVEGRAAFVLGNRHAGPGHWEIRQFARNSLLARLLNMGGIVFRVLFNALFNCRLADPTTMYKVFRAECLEGLSFTCNRFDFDFELLGKLIRAGFIPLEVPVSYKSRGFDQGKKIRIVRDGARGIFAILRLGLMTPRRKRRAPGAVPPERVPTDASSAASWSTRK